MQPLDMRNKYLQVSCTVSDASDTAVDRRDKNSLPRSDVLMGKAQSGSKRGCDHQGTHLESGLTLDQHHCLMLGSAVLFLLWKGEGGGPCIENSQTHLEWETTSIQLRLWKYRDA